MQGLGRFLSKKWRALADYFRRWFGRWQFFGAACRGTVTWKDEDGRQVAMARIGPEKAPAGRGEYRVAITLTAGEWTPAMKKLTSTVLADQLRRAADERKRGVAGPDEATDAPDIAVPLRPARPGRGAHAPPP